MNVICGARNRRGYPCRQRELFPNGRCRYHGGLSAGPKTTEGRAWSLANLAKRWAGRAQYPDCNGGLSTNSMDATPAVKG
jgi:hypothetical protein